MVWCADRRFNFFVHGFDGWFAVGEEWKPQRLRFEGPVDGRATVAEFNGARWYRSFEE